MKLYCINGGLRGENSAPIQLENKKFSCDNKNSAPIYRKRKEFSLDFIEKNQITLDNFSSHIDFLNLGKNEKDSIRYHLKKKAPRVKESTLPPEPNGKKKKERKEKASLSLGLLLLPIFAVEVVICILSERFYTSLGIEHQLAYILAIAVECFYMASTSMDGVGFQILKFMILAYSIFTVGYGNLLSDSNLINEREAMKYQISQKEATLRGLQEDLNALSSKEKVFISSMEAYTEERYISRGIKNVTPHLKKIEMQKALIRKDIVSVKASLNQDKQTQLEISSFKFSTLSKLQISTIVIIIGFLMVQICSSVFLSPSLKSLGKTYKKIINQMRKCKRWINYVQ